jgi:hypothetical protein
MATTDYWAEAPMNRQQIGKIAMRLGLIRLGEVAFDGTRVKANNSRYATRTAKTREEKLAAMDELSDHWTNRVSCTTPNRTNIIVRWATPCHVRRPNLANAVASASRCGYIVAKPVRGARWPDRAFRRQIRMAVRSHATHTNRHVSGLHRG